MSMLSLIVVAVLSLEATAIVVLLAAGHLYVRGELDRSRRLARRSGLSAAAFSVAAASSLVAARGVGLPAALALGAGVTALLGGLSGKPRPAGEIAALLWIASLVALLGGW